MSGASFPGDRRCGVRAAFGLLLLLAGLYPAFPYPVNTWKHIRNVRFTVSYSEEAKPLAGRALAIAEETARVLAEWFGYEFTGNGISIVLADQADDSNGWTSGRDPLVFIDCRPTLSLFRGETDWLRTVLTHELSHVYSLKVLNPPVVIGAFAGITSTADGFEVGAQETFGLNTVPMWFIEGIAQLGSWRLQADSRDPLREMMLRDALRGGQLLDAAQMARFEGTSRDYELAYNQGFSFLLYLRERYGEVTIRDLCRQVRDLGVERALQAAYGQPLARLLQDWRADLERRYAGIEPWGAGWPLFTRNGPMVMELAAARSGKLALANWGNDYTRFSLFQAGPDGRFRELARECGQVLRQDRTTGEVWFNRYAYDPASGVDLLDIYRVGLDGRIERITRASRSIAFDALDGVLVYARYRPERTELVRREPGGEEKVIGTVPPGQSVFSVSLVSREMAALSLGTGSGFRLALLANGELRGLWPEEEILDPVSAGDSRLLFVSSRTGAPQVYWADLREDAGLWYRLTGVAGGARFPALDGAPGAARLVYSVYEKGGYRLHAQEDPFTRDHPVRVEATGLAGPIAAPEPMKKAVSMRAEYNPVWSRPTFSVGLVSSRYMDGSETVTSWTGLAGFSAAAYDAPEELGLEAYGQLAFSLFSDVSVPPAVGLGLLGSFDLGPLRNSLEYSLETEVYYLWPGAHETVFHNGILAESAFQLASRQALSALYELTWHVDTATGYPSVTYLATHRAGLHWRYADSPRAAFDPAGLGQPVVSLYAGADLRVHTFPDPAYDPAVYDLDPHLMGRLVGGALWRILSPGSRLSAGLRLEGYSGLGSVRGGKPTPAAFYFIGGEGSFSGYPAGYAGVNDQLRAAVEVAANPFVDKADATRWYERARLELQLEAGVVRYWDGSLRTAWPLSAGIGLRQAFYLWANRESSVFLRLAVPLNDFTGGIERPWQVYLGYGS